MKYSAEDKAVLRRFAQSGGKARAKALTPAQRVAIAKQGAKARWASHDAKKALTDANPQA